jgi:hypothetical protein
LRWVLELIVWDLISFNELVEESTIVVLHTYTLLEVLLKELLAEIVQKVSKREYVEREEISSLFWNFPKREQAITMLTGGNLKASIKEEGFPNYYSNWKVISEKRNKFVHGIPWAFSASDVETAFNLAKDSFDVFAALHNRFCVEKKEGK